MAKNRTFVDKCDEQWLPMSPEAQSNWCIRTNLLLDQCTIAHQEVDNNILSFVSI
jgi:hypothetical protein